MDSLTRLKHNFGRRALFAAHLIGAP